jgi:CheY-like chemotaxis protein
MKPKVLIVDDDPVMHMLYGRHLVGAGYELLMARDGIEALAIAAREAPQLIMMDVMMAGMDGLSALRELKRTNATKSIPVVVITGNVGAHHATRKEAELAGAAGFLTKPFSPGLLLAEVTKIVPIKSEKAG